MANVLSKSLVSLFLPTLCLFVAAGCSQGKTAAAPAGQIPQVEVFSISSSKLVNCRFTQANPAYRFDSAIVPNTIICDEGLPKRMEVLSQGKLPEGLELDSQKLALVGTPKEKVSQAPFVIYLENEAGYAKIPLTLTVR